MESRDEKSSGSRKVGTDTMSPQNSVLMLYQSGFPEATVAEIGGPSRVFIIKGGSRL